MKRTKNNEHGFTLAELVVTIVVISAVFAAMSSLFISIQRAQARTAHLESATYAAQRQIESLRNSNYNNLVAGQNINFTDKLPTQLPPGSTGNVTVTEPSPGIKRVDVSVTYEYSGDTRTVRLSSLIGVIGIVQ